MKCRVLVMLHRASEQPPNVKSILKVSVSRAELQFVTLNVGFPAALAAFPAGQTQTETHTLSAAAAPLFLERQSEPAASCPHSSLPAIDVVGTSQCQRDGTCRLELTVCLENPQNFQQTFTLKSPVG